MYIYTVCVCIYICIYVTSCDLIVMTLKTSGKNMKNFKYCVISLNMLHTGGLYGILGFTARL